VADNALLPLPRWQRYLPWLAALTDDLPQWGEANAALYRTALEEAAAMVPVDTSKSAARAWSLWNSGTVDLKIVWLTRRSEDVLRS
jgi:hypothetical protein